MIDYRVLGVVSARRDDGPIGLGGPKQRALLAVLLAAPGTFVSVDAVGAALWGTDPPAKASASIRSYASNLRSALGSAAAIESRDHGYRVVLADDDTFDLTAYSDRVAAGRDALADGDPRAAATELAEAELIWGGDPFAEYPDAVFAQAVRTRWMSLRQNAVEARFDALLRTGHDAELIVDIESALADDPLQERLWGHLMLALHRSGRTADALRAYDHVREVLDAELGVRPGAGLRQIFAAINDQSDAADGRSGMPAFRSSLHFFLGRGPELAAMGEAGRRAAGGRGTLIIVSGDRGVGKSTLAHHVSESLPELTTVRAAQPSGIALPAMWTWIQVVRELGDVVGPDARAEICARMPDVVAALVPEWLPSGIPIPPAANGFRLTEGTVEIIRRAGCRHPLLLILDDLHGADEEALGVVHLLAAEIAGLPVLAVATWADFGAGRPMNADGLTALGAVSGAVTIGLRTFDRDDTGALFSYLTLRSDDVDVDHVWEQTGGNAFLIRDMALRVGARDQGPPGAGLVSWRLRGLEQAAVALAELSAVLGMRCAVVELADIADMSITATHEHVASIYRAGIIDEVTGVPGAFEFVHGIMRDAVLSEMSPDRRMQLHAQIAQRHPRTIAPMAYEEAIATADHAWQAGSAIDPEVALELNEAAVQRASLRSAYPDLEVALRHAIAVGDRLPRKPELIDRQATLWLHRAAVASIIEGQSSASASEAIERAIELGRHTHGRNYFGAIAGQCQLLCGQGRLAEARAIIRTLLDTGSVDETDAGMALLFAQVMVQGLSGDFHRARECGARLLELYPVAESPVDPLYFFHPRVYCFMAIANAWLGDEPAARKNLREGRALAESRSDVFNILSVDVTSIEVDVIVGWQPTTAAAAESVAEQMLSAGAAQWAACAQMVAAWARAMTPDCADAVDTAADAENAYATYTFDGSAAMTPYFLCLRADIDIRFGRTDSAHRLMSAAEAMALATGEHAWDDWIVARMATLSTG